MAEENEARAETKASLDRAFQEGRLLHVKNQKQEEQINQLQQRVSILTQEMQTSAAGSAQSLEDFNQKEGLINQLTDRIQELESQLETFQLQNFELKQQLEQSHVRYQCDLDNAQNEIPIEKGRVK